MTEEIGTKEGEIETEEQPEDNAPEKPKRRRKRKRKQKSEAEETEEPDASLLDAKCDELNKQVERTIYVEGIPFDLSPEEVKGFFHDNGIQDIVECRLPVWHDSGRLRGYGHLVFESTESYDKALKLSGKYLQKRYLTIQAAKKPKNIQAGPDADAEPSRTLILNNLAYAATEDDIEKVASKYGTISEGGVRVVRHSQTQVSKGFGFVEFESVDSARNMAENAERISISGRPCRIDYDHGRVKGSFRGSNGKLWQKNHT